MLGTGIRCKMSETTWDSTVAEDTKIIKGINANPLAISLNRCGL